MTALAAFVLQTAIGLIRGVRGRPFIGHHVANLRGAMRPPDDVVLTSQRGDLYTGLILVVDNLPLLVLAARHAQPGPHHRPSPRPPTGLSWDVAELDP